MQAGLRRRRVCAVLALVWLLCIWGHSLVPAAQSSAESGALLSVLSGAFPWLTEHLLRKTAHFLEYALLGGLCFGALWGARRYSLYAVLFAGVLVALADETIQLHVPGRSGQLTDVWLDSAGYVLAAAACRLAAARR